MRRILIAFLLLASTSAYAQVYQRQQVQQPQAAVRGVGRGAVVIIQQNTYMANPYWRPCWGLLGCALAAAIARQQAYAPAPVYAAPGAYPPVNGYQGR